MITEQPARIVLKRLRTAGWTFRREGKGSHAMWQCPGGTHTTIIPSGHSTIRPGVVRTIDKAIAGCSCEPSKEEA